MGFFRFRQTFKIAPGIRFNLSKSGPSVSFGPRGLHYTIGLKGSRTTVGIPGSGISWTAYQRYQAPTTESNIPLGISDPVEQNQNATVFESVPIQQLAATSTVEISQKLSANRARWLSQQILLGVFAAIIIVAGTILYGNAPGGILNGAVIVIFIGACITWLATALYCRQSLTVSLEYNLSGAKLESFNRLASAFDALARCGGIWQIPLEISGTDWKRHAGATKTVERKRISLSAGQPALIKSNMQFLQLVLANESIYLTPDSILIVARDTIAALRYDDLEIVCGETYFRESGSLPGDAKVVSESWQYVNRDGSPDRRFANNRKVPICLYAEIDLKSNSGLNERIHCSRLDSSQLFAACMNSMRSTNPVASPDNSSTDTKSSPLPAEPAIISAGTNLSAAYANESEAARTLAFP